MNSFESAQQCRHKGGTPERLLADHFFGSAEMDIMEARIIKLESAAEKSLDRLFAVERDVAIILSNYATKEDLAAMEARILKWFVGTAITLAGVAFAAAKWIN